MSSWFQKILGQESDLKHITTSDAADALEIRKDFLRKVTYTDVDFFHLNGYTGWGKVVKTYDGDTIHCVLFVNGKPLKFKFRLANIDTAEKRSKDPAEAAWAIKARDRLIELSEDGLIWVHCFRHDKYGRILADLYHEPNEGFSFNDALVAEGLAYEYHGGTRSPFREWAPEKAWKKSKDGKIMVEIRPVDNIRDPAILEEDLKAEGSELPTTSLKAATEAN